MTKNELESVIMNAMDHLDTCYCFLEHAIDDAKKAAIRYDGNEEENLAFEVGYLRARINAAMYYLEKSGLMSNNALFTDEGPEYDSAGFSEADRMQEEEQSHHCDDLSCNCSI